MRPIELTRTEAEYIVDKLEEGNIPQWKPLADELRKQWGMSLTVMPYVMPQDVKRATTDYHGLKADVAYLDECEAE